MREMKHYIRAPTSYTLNQWDTSNKLAKLIVSYVGTCATRFHFYKELLLKCLLRRFDFHWGK